MILQLVISTGGGVNGFTLDPSLGEFILTHPDIKVSLLDLNLFPESPIISVKFKLGVPCPLQAAQLRMLHILKSFFRLI